MLPISQITHPYTPPPSWYLPPIIDRIGLDGQGNKPAAHCRLLCVCVCVYMCRVGCPALVLGVGSKSVLSDHSSFIGDASTSLSTKSNANIEYERRLSRYVSKYIIPRSTVPLSITQNLRKSQTQGYFPALVVRYFHPHTAGSIALPPPMPLSIN